MVIYTLGIYGYKNHTSFVFILAFHDAVYVHYYPIEFFTTASHHNFGFDKILLDLFIVFFV
jgi:hypothetical protein